MAISREQTLCIDGDVRLLRQAGRGPRSLRWITGSESPSHHRLRNEFLLRGSLSAAWAVQPVGLEVDASTVELLLRDPGAPTLESALGEPWALDTFFESAIAVVTSVAAMHGSGVLHRDLLPDRILLDPARRAAWITGFGVAVRAASAPAAARDGTSMYRATYLAPEQTGKLNRAVDRRADLYSLGVILHRMLTGELPLAGESARDMAHAHVALKPAFAAEGHPGVPPAVASIVLKLLSKPVDERYATAASLLADLRHAQAEWLRTGTVAAFLPATRERHRRPVASAGLFGRAAEVGVLEAAVQQVAGNAAGLLTVAGYSGAGKSALVRSLDLQGGRGPCRLIAGKADELGQVVPFGALKRALAELEPFATSPAGDLAEAMGEYAAVLVHLEPSLERLLGVSAAPAGATAVEIEVRVREGVRRLLSHCARADAPLVCFIDDLQWVDPATLALLKHLLTAGMLKNVLFVGAFRSEEVGPDHAVSLWLDTVREGGVAVTEIVLAPLDVDAVGDLVADALQTARPAVGRLAEVVHGHTAGNVFFAVQYLGELAEAGLLVDDEARGDWVWDEAAVAAASDGSGLLHLMLGKLDRLPPATRGVLERLACLGHRTELVTLQRVTGLGEADFRRALWPAAHRGLVVASGGQVQFVHDRVLEAASASIPVRRRPLLHLAVGLRLRAAAGDPARPDSVFDVVHQLNLGRSRLRSEHHLTELAALNLAAARLARDQGAYASAAGFAAAGIDVQGAGAPDTGFELRLLCAECHILLRDDARAAAQLAELLPRAAGRLDRARVFRLQVVLHVVRSAYALAVGNAIEGLRDFGVALVPHPPKAEVRERCERLLVRLDGLEVAALVDATGEDRAEVEAAMSLLAEMFAPACFTDEALAILHLCRMVELTLDHGLTSASPHGLAWFGIMVGHHFGRHQDGHQLARLARDLVLQRGFASYEAKSLFALEITEVWVRPLDQAIATSRAAHRAGVDRGDLAVACFACNHTVNDLLVRGEPLEAVADEIERSLVTVGRAGFRDVVDELVTQQRWVMALRGRTEGPGSFDGPGFSSAEFERGLTTDRMPTMVFWYWVLRAQLSFLAGDVARAERDLDTASQWLWSSPVHIQFANFHFFYALVLAGGTAKPDGDRLDAHVERLQHWAQASPATFGHMAALAGAERARVRGDTIAAAAGYERAARLAGDAGALHVEAMASECAARFHGELGLPTSAHAWWSRARQAYAAWGAEAKLREIDALTHTDEPDAIAAGASDGPDLLELAVVRRVSEAIVGEVDIDTLVRALMVTALEHAGAQRGLLLLPHEGGMRTRASATTGQGGIQVAAHQDAPVANDLPLSLLEAVCRLHQPVLLDDAARGCVYAADPYVCDFRPRSVLCMPLMKQGRLVAVLYLENRLVPQVFSPDRVALLELIATQSAIALENAALYSDLVRENRDRQMAEAEASRARDALEESESRFRHMAETTPDVIWITDVHPEKVLYANASFERIWGRQVQELYDDPRVWVEGIHPDDRAAVGELFSAWIGAADEPWQANFRVLRPDGTIRRVLDRGFAKRDANGHVVRVSGLATDVTERYAAETALKESEERFALAVAGSNDGIWDWDLSTQRLFMSDQAQRLYGMAPGPHIRSHAEWMDGLRIHPEDAESREQLLADYLGDRCDTFDGEWRVSPDGGPWRWIRVRGVCVRDANGHPTRMAGSVSDIDAKRRAEAALRQAQRLEAVGTLASGIAHDFNNILGAILGFGESALRRTRPGGRLRRDLECILIGGERGKALVEQILLFSRSGVAERLPVHVEAVVVECMSLVAGRLPAEVSVETSLEAGAAAMLGDATQIHQVVMNLATNAVQSMPEGGRLVVSLAILVLDRARLVTTAVMAPGPYFVLRIEDTGTGIDPEIRARIFDPFFTTKDVGSGTGLGLSLVHGIVTELGGGIDVASTPGAGSAFTVYLPRAAEAPGSDVAPPRAVPTGSSGRSLLVVDDDLTLLQWTTQTLADAGYAPVPFSSAEAALEAFRADPEAFDLVLSDERMPRLSGTQLVEGVRRAHATIPVVLVSGFLDEALKQRAAEVGATLVLGKPVTARKLTTSVARLVKPRTVRRRAGGRKTGGEPVSMDQPVEPNAS